jgi:hypothetical protein
MKILFVFSLPILTISSMALAADEDPAYRGEIAAKVKSTISAVGKAQSEIAKIDEIKKLKAELDSEKERVRKELERATETKSKKDEVAKLDARDTEIVRIWYSSKTVFDKVLVDSFEDNAEYRRTTCGDLESVVRFKDMAPLPDGSTPPAWTQLTLDLAAAICSRSQEPGR